MFIRMFCWISTMDKRTCSRCIFSCTLEQDKCTVLKYKNFSRTVQAHDEKLLRQGRYE